MKNKLYLYFLFASCVAFSQNDTSNLSYKQQSYVIDTLQSVNTKNSDFGVSYIGNNEVVFSSPKKRKFFLRKWFENKQGYLELYKAKIGAEGSLQDVSLYSDKLNSIFHESNIALTNDGKHVYFTSNTHEGNKRIQDKEGYTNLQLYKADVNDGVYSNIKLLPFNSQDFSTGHPVLSKDEKILYFVSDRPGGFGKTDLYKVNLLGDDNYSTVQNLGSNINSSEKEMFPFVDLDNVLYFSSDRINGAGGLDVYAISLSNLDDTLYHLPEPINSVKDDFSFVLGANKTGYLSSNREGGQGDDDIYKIVLERCFQNLNGFVYNKYNKKALPDAKVYIYNDQKIIDSLTTDNQGSFLASFDVSCDENYTVKASKTSFKDDQTTIVTKNTNNVSNTVSLNLEPLKCLQYIAGSVLESNTNEPLNLAKVYIYDNNVLIDSTTSNLSGKYASYVSTNCNAKYTVKATKDGFGTSNKSLTTSSKSGYTNIVDLSLEQYAIDDKLNIKPIYFDLDKSFIRPDAAKVLDEVVATMNKFPNLVLEGGSHTDSRQTNSYNESLSSRRAKSTVRYIISKGISPNRISSRGYGETQLVNRCKDDVPCTEEEHQLNRRTEFKIIKK